eukprot:241976-Chlamydomonas_euryale.AAC.7
MPLTVLPMPPSQGIPCEAEQLPRGPAPLPPLPCHFPGWWKVPPLPFLVPPPVSVIPHLAGQLHRVPINSTDARHHALIHRGQHVLQRVAKLMEERLHLAERHQAGLAADGGALVAHHVRDRQAHGGAVWCHQLGASHNLVAAAVGRGWGA